MDIIDLVNPVLLDEKKWIGQGRTYPTSNPSREWIVYCDSHLEIPTLTHSPAVTNDGGMMAIVREDHEVFKTLNSRREDIKGAAIALGGKKKKSHGN